MVRFTVLIFTVVLLLSPPEGAVAQERSRLPRIFVESSVDHPIALDIARTLGRPRPVPFGSRVLVATAEQVNDSLDRYIAALTDADVAVWLAVDAPASVEHVDQWRRAVRGLLARHTGDVAVVEVVYGDQPESLRRFILQVASTEAHASARTTRVAVSGRDRQTTEELLAGLTRDAVPYVDLFVLPPDVDTAALERLATAVPELRWTRRDQETGDVTTARQRIVRDVLMTVGTPALASAWKGEPDAIADAIRALAPASDLMTHDVTPMDVAATGFALRQAGRDARDTVPSRLLFDDETFATYLVYESDSTSPPVEATLRLAVDGRPVLLDLVAGEVKPLGGFTRDLASSLARAVLPSTGRPMLVNFSEGAEVQFVDRTGVAAVRELTVEEIIARHREHQVRQDALLQHYRASVVMEQHFRPSLTDPGYDVVTENEYFFDKDGVEWEERSFSVNGSRWDVNRPPFPLLQPEKVLSLPLELRLDEDYRYELDGRELVDAIDCYRVHFEPTRADAALYRGTVWIDRQSFARRRLRAVQTRTSAPVVSNEEIHTYAPVAEVAGVPLLLMTRLTARQIVLIAGRNLLLEKAATFSSFRVNDSMFAEAREEARQGPRVMYRETERGVRYFLKDGEQRVVSERATASARAMAMGVLIDPSFAFPLPIFGINYLDFEFRGRADTQFALLFGGVLAAGNLQRPRLGGTNIDASIDFFGIAAPASDRLYGQGGERASEALLTWPLSTGVNLGWQYTPFQKAQLQYQVRFDPFVRDRTTDESFVVPSSTVTQGLGGAWEFKRAGYSIAANGTYYFRANWKPWGPSDALETEPPRSYAKYAVHITRDFFVDAFQKVHLNASYFGGNRLDRFSRYQFGMFDDTRIHGVPASGVRFDNLGMIRGSYSFNIFEQYRLDLFAEQAWGQDRTIDRAWQPLTGLGFAVNLRAPWNTILRADVGKSLLPDRYSGAGSTVLQVMLLKPLGGG
jgi:hypothetical protein